MRTNIIKLAYVILGTFLILILYLGYLYLHKGEFLSAHPKNPRTIAVERETLRGTIFDRKGRELAESIDIDGNLTRHYPYKDAFSHVVGYTTVRGVKTGLEVNYDAFLLGFSDEQRLRNFYRELKGEPREGLDLVTTLDAELQVLGQQLLRGKRGSIVAINPQTGAVLALVSAPTFDANRVTELLAQLNADEGGKPLLNRGTQGVYPPGSILKVMTGAGILEKEPGFDEITDCPGFIQVGDYKLQDLGVHGRINFDNAMKVSCNTTFAKIGLRLGSDRFYNLALNFDFNQRINFDLGVKQSFIPKGSDITEEELAQSVIGQGRILVTPMHMAVLTATVANEGKKMTPHLVSAIQTKEGRVIETISPREEKVVISETTAKRLQGAMRKVVTEGTGKRAALRGIEVAGKTGTAENPHGQPHSWFIGFAPMENPTVAVAVIVENGGFGSQEGATIAGTIIEKALRN